MHVTMVNLFSVQLGKTSDKNVYFYNMDTYFYCRYVLSKINFRCICGSNMNNYLLKRKFTYNYRLYCLLYT